MNQRIYLDNNASTAIDPRVLQTMVENLSTSIGNPSSIHSYGQASRAQLAHARHTVAAYLKVKPEEIVFTSGGTEGMNMLIRGMIAKKNGHVISSNVEHACIYNTLTSLEKNGTPLTWMKAGLAGAVTPQQVQNAIRSDTCLLILTAVNSETGVKIDLPAIAALAEAAHIPLIIDGVALLGKESITIPTGVAAMCFSAHKIHGPKGVGFVWIRKGTALCPLLTGGPQENGRRGGTENLAGIVGLARAIQLLVEEGPKAYDKMHALRDRLEKGIQSSVAGVSVNGFGARAPNVSNLSFAGIEGETLIALLDSQGVAVSHGSACASGALEPSRILTSMGIPLTQAASAIRFSLSRFTTETEIERTIEIVARLVSQLRKLTKSTSL